MTLTAAQQVALTAIQNHKEEVFGNFWNPATKRQISKATLSALCKNGLIEVVRVQEYTTRTRSSIGWNAQLEVVTFYRLVK
jgi:hypothetical protein